MKRSVKVSELPDNWAKTHKAEALLKAASGMKLKVVALRRYQDSLAKFIHAMADYVPRDYGILVPVRRGRTVRHYIVYPQQGFESVVCDNRTDFVDLTGHEFFYTEAYDYQTKKSRVRECKVIGEYKSMKMKLDIHKYLTYAGTLLKRTDNKLR